MRYRKERDAVEVHLPDARLLAIHQIAGNVPRLVGPKGYGCAGKE
jgi:hypothetical protein